MGLKYYFVPSYITYGRCEECGRYCDVKELKSVIINGTTSSSIKCCNDCFMKIISRGRI